MSATPGPASASDRFETLERALRELLIEKNVFTQAEVDELR